MPETKHCSIPIKLFQPDLPPPVRAHDHDGAFDFYAPIDLCVYPGEYRHLALGFGLAIPPGYAGFVETKSGHGKMGVISTGPLIDAGYRGQIGMTIFNGGRNRYIVDRHQKLGQLIILKVGLFKPSLVAELPPSCDGRGENGFGSNHTC